MWKDFLKTFVLIFIVLSIYFIVNPSSCSNFLAGRVTNITDQEPQVDFRAEDHSEMFVPAGDRPLSADAQTPEQPLAVQDMQLSTGPVQGITDTNSLNEPAPQTGEKTDAQTPQYSQDEIDYAIASRYVELENEYAKLNKTGKDVAKEISYKVMDDFELTQSEWEAFLERATASNLFNKVRTEQAAEQK